MLCVKYVSIYRTLKFSMKQITVSKSCSEWAQIWYTSVLGQYKQKLTYGLFKFISEKN